MEIDLGREIGSLEVPEPIGKPEKTKVYPTLWLDGVEGLDLPDEGTMTVHFCKTAENTRARGGEKSVSFELEIKKLSDISGRKTKKGKSREEELDELAEEEYGKSEKSED